MIEVWEIEEEVKLQ